MLTAEVKFRSQLADKRCEMLVLALMSKKPPMIAPGRLEAIRAKLHA
jgi:hypothetical protein